MGHITLFAGELPWRDNRSNVSCIPQGTYHARETYSPRFKKLLYSVEDVEGRFGIRIHPANLMGDKSLGFFCQLNGCIALGEKMGVIENQKALLISRPAIDKFVSALNHKPFELEIVNEFR